MPLWNNLLLKSITYTVITALKDYTMRILDRELKKYHALKSYFLSEHERDNRFKRLNESFQCPMSEIYLMFFHSAIALLTNFNRFLQREDPLIYLMHAQMEKFLNKLAVKFTRPEKVMEHKTKVWNFEDSGH